MTTLIRLLPAEATPAQTVLAKAHALPLTSTERATLPQTVHTPTGDVTIAVPADQLRAVEVEDVFLDEKGAFWAVRPAVEKVLHVTGDINIMREAVGALINRGVRLAQIEEGFSVLPLPNLAQMLEMVGLEVTEAEEPFDPIRFVEEPAEGCGCGCGCGGHHHHHHHEEGECGCGCGGHHHHHHDEEECGCGCGGHHHHHHEEGECCCGHDHHHEEGECCCGHDHHHEEGECCCGHDHHHEEGECCCGHDHHHEEGECCCGHDHHHEEGECCCGHDHHHEHAHKDGECCCGGKCQEEKSEQKA